MVRSLACSLGPLLTGILAARDLWAWSFYLCGGLKLAYDCALLWSARSIEMHLEQEQGQERGGGDGPAAAAVGGGEEDAGGTVEPAGREGAATNA